MPGQPIRDDRGSSHRVAGEAAGEPEDRELVASAKIDPHRFAPLYARYLDPVYRYCYRRLGTREAAEDATAQVFVKALAALSGCREDSFRPWLFAIAHSVTANRRRDSRPADPITDAEAMAHPDPTPEEAALAAEERQTLWELLALLPPGQRDVVELRLSGLTGPETARALGRSLGSIHVAQVRAFARLRDLYGVAPKETVDEPT